MVCSDSITNLGLTPSSQLHPVHLGFPQTDHNIIAFFVCLVPSSYLSCKSQFQPLQLQEAFPELFWGRYRVLTTLSVLLLPQPQYLVHNQYYALFFNEHSVNQWINDSLFQGILTCSDELFTCQPPPPRHESMRNHVSHLQSSVPETVLHTSWYLMAFSEWMNDWMNEKNFIFLGIIWH